MSRSATYYSALLEVLWVHLVAAEIFSQCPCRLILWDIYSPCVLAVL